MSECIYLIQGTTPTHSMALPFPASFVKRARFVYEQFGSVVLTKDTTDSLQIKDGKAVVTLTQKETYGFTPLAEVELTLRILTEKGEAIKSDPVTMICLSTADKEELI